MKYVDEFRDRGLMRKLADAIQKAAYGGASYNFMEVCGTHTMNIFRYGLRDLLPDSIKLISGPGCPVCVTPNDYLDKAIEIANRKNVIITTFGDMLKVPGSHSSLEKERSEGREIRIVYSTVDALGIAKKNPDKEVVFLGIGFETTAPTIASSILTAEGEGIRNYSVLCGHKTMPEVMGVLVGDKKLKIDGFLLPGHVSAVTGSKPYLFLAKRYLKRCVISGFEPMDILQSILMLIEQNRPRIEIQYSRIISADGNVLARKAINRVFEKASSNWRGIGVVENSGLKIRKGFSGHDAEIKFRPKGHSTHERKGCICGDVLKGIKTPKDCRLFGKACVPEKPVGACMVSSEGTCAAYYKYGS